MDAPAQIANREYRLASVDELTEHPDNPREGNVEAIATSIDANGFYGAVIVQESTGYVLAGNHRLKAAKHSGLESVPAIFVDVNDDVALRILLADNRTNDLATYDDSQLLELLERVEADADLFGTGYSPEDVEALRKLLAAEQVPETFTDPDDVPIPPANPQSKEGDVWILGPHRLVVGDSTDTEVLAAVMAGDQAGLVWTDPPYGVSYVGGTGLTIKNDDLAADELTDFLRQALGAALTFCKPGAGWYVAAPSGPQFLSFATVLTELGVWRQTLIWEKDSLALGRSDYHYRHEAIFYGWTDIDSYQYEHLMYGWKPGAAHHAPPDRKQDTVWSVPRPKRSKEHPTMKPVALITRALQNSSDAFDIVLDSFGGSGSTLIAAHDTNRRARLVELDPRYADVICRRFQEHTNITPVLESSGAEINFMLD